MFLTEKSTNDLIEIIRIEDLYDPCLGEVMGRSHCGEEMQEPAIYPKENLMFPSGEMLPLCWVDRNYATRKSAATTQAVLVR